MNRKKIISLLVVVAITAVAAVMYAADLLVVRTAYRRMATLTFQQYVGGAPAGPRITFTSEEVADPAEPDPVYPSDTGCIMRAYDESVNQVLHVKAPCRAIHQAVVSWEQSNGAFGEQVVSNPTDATPVIFSHEGDQCRIVKENECKRCEIFVDANCASFSAAVYNGYPGPDMDPPIPPIDADVSYDSDMATASIRGRTTPTLRLISHEWYPDYPDVDECALWIHDIETDEIFHAGVPCRRLLLDIYSFGTFGMQSEPTWNTELSLLSVFHGQRYCTFIENGTDRHDEFTFNVPCKALARAAYKVYP